MKYKIRIHRKSDLAVYEKENLTEATVIAAFVNCFKMPELKKFEVEPMG